MSDAPDICCQAVNNGASLGFASEHAPERQDHFQDLRYTSLIKRYHIHAAHDQRPGNILLQIGKRKDQVELYRHDLLELCGCECRHLRFQSSFRWSRRIAGTTHNPVLLPEKI